MQARLLQQDTARLEKRPLPDSNRGWRICNPLPYRLAKGPYELRLIRDRRPVQTARLAQSDSSAPSS